MQSSTNTSKWGLIAILGALASVVTILGFFGITHFPAGSNSNPTSNPGNTGNTPVINVQVSTPAATLQTFCSALSHSDISTANGQLTPRYLNYVESLPSSTDPYTGCSFGPLAESSTAQGVIYYYASITFYHQSGTMGYGTVDLIKTSDGSWRIDEINCGANYC